jgi:hypothetical protein
VSPLHGTKERKLDGHANGRVVGFERLEEQVIVVVPRQSRILGSKVDGGEQRLVFALRPQILCAGVLLRGLYSRIAIRRALHRIVVLSECRDRGNGILRDYDVCCIQTGKLGEMMLQDLG